MDWKEWMPYYEAITRDLSLDPAMDRRTGALLAEMLSQNASIAPFEETLMCVSRLVEGRDVFILGGGPGLESELDRLIARSMEKGRWSPGVTGKDVIIAADGTTSSTLARGFPPHIIVTDLDGGVEDQLLCLDSGSIMFVHAHGDNIGAITRFAPQLRGHVIGTVQTEPSSEGPLFNFGGFTDGDRAAFIASHFGCSSMTLLGFDMEGPGGKVLNGGYREGLSGTAYDRKFRKLTWANALLSLMDEHRVRYFEQKDAFY